MKLSKRSLFNPAFTRAVFGETYPDPVLVVSVGVPVEDLLNDPKNPEWMKYSVEFCGGTHIASTKQIKDFSIVSFSGVGSGVKRIIAVTGDMVREVRNNAATVKTLLEDGFKAPLATKEKTLSQVNTKITDLLLPILDRRFLEEKRDELLKTINQEKKEKETLFLERIEKIKQEVKEKSSEFRVEHVDVASDKKLLSSGTIQLEKECPDTAFLFFFTMGSDLLSYQATVPKKLAEKLPASDWIKSINDKVKGKGGGKSAKAEGVCSDQNLPMLKITLDDLIKVAEEFAKSKLGGNKN